MDVSPFTCSFCDVPCTRNSGDPGCMQSSVRLKVSKREVIILLHPRLNSGREVQR